VVLIGRKKRGKRRGVDRNQTRFVATLLSKKGAWEGVSRAVKGTRKSNAFVVKWGVQGGAKTRGEGVDETTGGEVVGEPSYRKGKGEKSFARRGGGGGHRTTTWSGGGG